MQRSIEVESPERSGVVSGALANAIVGLVYQVPYVPPTHWVGTASITRCNFEGVEGGGAGEG